MLLLLAAGRPILRHYAIEPAKLQAAANTDHLPENTFFFGLNETAGIST